MQKKRLLHISVKKQIAMSKCENKHISSITYNHLNLPTRINFDTGSYITYLYDAAGVKNKKIVYTQATPPTTAVTEYKGIFQYTSKAGSTSGEVELQFVFTAEGYVNNTVINNTDTYNYVYNYTDHLGNIRLSYTWNEDLQELSTLEEHQYYPFGLEHKYYNNTRKMYDKQTEEVTLADGGKIAITKAVIVQVPNSGYQYQYQGQERQDELNLNWDSFKYRNYDYAIGRFMSVDPLAEKYNTWSPYTFSGNRVVDARELEGLEPNILYDSLDDAATNFVQQYNGVSIINETELGTRFYQEQQDGKTCYSYVTPIGTQLQKDENGKRGGIEVLPKLPNGKTPADSDAHTHGNDNNEISITGGDNVPSSEDIESTREDAKGKKNGYTSYVGTPNGTMFKIQPWVPGQPKPEKGSTVKKMDVKNIPSDPNSTTRKNDVSPEVKPDVMPIITDSKTGKPIEIKTRL